MGVIWKLMVACIASQTMAGSSSGTITSYTKLPETDHDEVQVQLPRTWQGDKDCVPKGIYEERKGKCGF